MDDESTRRWSKDEMSNHMEHFMWYDHINMTKLISMIV